MIERQILVIEETRPADSSTQFFQDYAEANLGIRPEDGGRPIDGLSLGGKQYSHTVSEIYNL